MTKKGVIVKNLLMTITLYALSIGAAQAEVKCKLIVNKDTYNEASVIAKVSQSNQTHTNFEAKAGNIKLIALTSESVTGSPEQPSATLQLIASNDDGTYKHIAISKGALSPTAVDSDGTKSYYSFSQALLDRKIEAFCVRYETLTSKEKKVFNITK